MLAKDLWSAKDLAPVTGGVLTVGPLAGHDSVLVLLTLPDDDAEEHGMMP